MSTKNRADTLAAVEAEIREEMAASLGRVGQRLEACIEELGRLATEAAAADVPSRTALVARYNELRAEAEEHLFALVVQREAMGLRNHTGLERTYPIPPRLRLDERKG